LITETQAVIYTPLFIVAIIHNSPKKQPKCPQRDKSINNMWYVNAMECYSVIKRDEILMYNAAWMNLEDIILSKRSQPQKGYII
jgi:hypothetical protein